MKKCVVVSLSVLLFLGCAVELIYAHGVIGRRFIPTTLVVDDPFASDELDLLRVHWGSQDKEGSDRIICFLTPERPANLVFREQATPNSASNMFPSEVRSMKVSSASG